MYVPDEKAEVINDKASFDKVPFTSVSGSEFVVIAFRLRLVKAGLGKAVVKPRTPSVIAKAGFAVKAKHAVRIVSF